MQWYYAVSNERRGPVSEEEFTRLRAQGVITDLTQVWREGMAKWQLWGEVAAAVAAEAADDTAICAVSGQRCPKREMVQFEGRWISAEHRDEYFQRLREGALPASDLVVYGGFWIRFAAKFIDGILLYIVGILFNVVIAVLVLGSPNYFGSSLKTAGMHKMLVFYAFSVPISLAIGLSYAWYFISRYDATIGKMAVGLKILRPDGSKLGTGRIIGRYFAEMLSGLTLTIGYIMAGFDHERRALHDRVADTRVIKVK